MPRLPVDGKKVVEHRITLGQFERTMLNDLVSSKQFNNIATPTVDLLKDVTGLAAFTAILFSLFGIVINLNDITDIGDLEKQIKNGYAKWRREKNAEYIERRQEQGKPINEAVLNYSPDEPQTLQAHLSFILGGLRELYDAGGFPGGY